MKRIAIEPRNAWQAKVEELGFGFHTSNMPYWDEHAYYSFNMKEVEILEAATIELWDMCLEAVQYVIDENLFDKFCIPDWFVPQIIKSWNQDHPAIYGRFDLCYKEGYPPKLLEFNADTPTSLFEAGIVQWYWLQDRNPSLDQFNSIHEKLTAYWAYLKPYLHPGALYFTCVKRNLEDLTTTEYLRDCAMQADIDCRFIFIDDIGWNPDAKVFVDTDDREIKNIFKLYPYEFMLEEDFGKNLIQDVNNAYWIEPAWKMVLSNKAILAILWELYPDHPLLLPCYFEQNGLKSYVKKPIFSREGANIEIVKDGQSIEKTGGMYGKEGYVYQAFFELPDFSGNKALIGSWVIGQEPAGMGIRETNSLITDNTSRFIPHLIDI